MTPNLVSTKKQGAFGLPIKFQVNEKEAPIGMLPFGHPAPQRIGPSRDLIISKAEDHSPAHL